MSNLLVIPTLLPSTLLALLLYIAQPIDRVIARYITYSIVYFIPIPKIYSLNKVPELDAKISKVKFKKLCDNTLSQNNLDTRVVIYIIWKYLVLGLQY